MKKGDVYQTNKCGELVIVEFVNYQNVKVRFTETGSVITARGGAIRKGEVKDYIFPSICGVGYLGIGDYKCWVDGKSSKEYVSWNSMLHRCYDEKLQERYPTYRGCSVCKEWHNFQVFSEWYNKRLTELNTEGEYEVDKDILYKGNKIYSPDTCCLVTSRVNCLLTYTQSDRGLYPVGVSLDKRTGKFKSQVCTKGKPKQIGKYPTPELASEAYIKAKEIQIKEQALISYNNNEMTKETYEALMQWEINNEGEV